MRAPIALGVAACLLLQACGSDVSLTGYAEEVEALVITMNARLDELDAEIEGSEDLERIKRYARERVAARNAFLDGLDALEPPDDVAELHATALDIVGRLTDAEEVLSDRVQAVEPGEGIGDIWATPEGRAALAADVEAIALCRAAQEELDTTERGEGFENAPWIPDEMKEVIRVAFGCEAEDR